MEMKKNLDPFIAGQASQNKQQRKLAILFIKNYNYSKNCFELNLYTIFDVTDFG